MRLIGQRLVKQPMQKEIKKTFSQDERARLRAALLAYMEEHRIGVPTLQLRVADASGRGPDLVPLKTLQRFLAGMGRAHDASLIPYFQFAETLSPANEGSGLAQFALAFFGATPDRNELAGKWEVFTPPKFRGWSVRRGDDIHETSGFGTIEIHAGKTCPVTIERVVNDQRKTFTNPDPSGRNLVYEGILINKEGLVFILSRNCLTRTPRTYWLREDDQGNLIGDGTEALITNDNKNDAQTSVAKFGFYRD